MNYQPWYASPWVYAYQTLSIYRVIIYPGRIHTPWRLFFFHSLFTFLELWVLGQFTNPPAPYLCTITNSLLILAMVSYYRVIHHHTEVFHDATDLEFRLWRRFGRSTDENLQLNLGKRLRLQQIERRTAKYAEIAARETRERSRAPEGTEAEALAEENRKFERLASRCTAAFEACQRLSVSDEERRGKVANEAVRAVDIDKRTGKDILRWLAGEIKESEGFIKPVKWSKDKKTGAIICHNGYTDENIPVDYFANSDDLIIGSVSVTKPSQIEPALSLIETALDHIRFYDVNNFPGHEADRLHPTHTQFRRAVAVSCEMRRYGPEFVKGKFGILDIDAPNCDDAWEKGNGKYVDKDRELVSLLTVSVDRYLTVTFHIAYMLQHCVESTRRNLQILFQDLILNRHKIKIWKNTPRSIAALDATLEHIFRGSGGADQEEGPGRQRYLASLRKPFRDMSGPTDILRVPGYKDTGPDELLHFNRPTDTEFQRGQDGQESPPCPLQLHAPGLDYANRTCACDKGIIDITAIVDFILRQHKFIGIEQEAPHALRPWVAPHSHSDITFCDLTRWLLAGHKWQPFLCRFKEKSHIEPQKPNTQGLEPNEAQEFTNIHNMRYNMHKIEQNKLFSTGGETRDIERDDMCLSYVVGEAIGLGLILRNLLTCESSVLMAERLSYYAYKHPLKVPLCAFDTALFRRPVDPTVLPPLEKCNSFTLGLELDGPETVYGSPSTPAWEKLASNPAWYLKQSTHGKVSKDLTYSGVISTAFILTGWEHPSPPEIPDPRLDPPKRFGMTTPAKLTKKLENAATVSLAELDRANRAAKVCAFEAVEKALETNFMAGITDAFALRLELAIDSLGGSRSNEPTSQDLIQDKEKGRAIDRLTREMRLAARATRNSARLVYDLREITINLLALIQDVALVPLPTTVEEAMARAAAEATISSLAMEATERAAEAELISRTVYTSAVDLEMTSKNMFPHIVLEDLERSEELQHAKEVHAARMAEAQATRLQLNESGVRAYAHAKSRVEIPAAAGSSNPDIENVENLERQKLAKSLLNAVVDLQEMLITDSTSRTRVFADFNTAITRREELDTLCDDEQAVRDSTRRRKPGERVRAQERRLVLQRAVSKDRAEYFHPRYLTTLRKGSEKARVAFDEARLGLEVARAREVAEGNRAVMRAQGKLKEVMISVAFRRAEMAVTPSPERARELATVENRLQNAQNVYGDAVGAVHIGRGTEIQQLVSSQTNLENAYLTFANTTISLLRGTYDSTTYAISRDFEAPEEIAIIDSIQELLGLSTIMDRNAKVLKDMIGKLSTESMRSERISNKAKQSIIARETFATRLPTLTAGKLIVEGNFGLALTVRNLAARNFRASFKFMPQEYARPLLETATYLNNFTWFEMFSDLFKWHCGLGAEEAQGIPPANPAISPNTSEETIRRDFSTNVTAKTPAEPQSELEWRAVDGLPVPGSLGDKIGLHDFVNLLCAETLIFMLVREISNFEDLDAARRLVLGIDRAVSDYSVVVGHSLWESVTIGQAKREFQLENFIYQDAHWFKRLQVLLGYEFAQNISIQSSSSRVVRECGARDIPNLVEMLISEAERFLKIYKYQEELTEYLQRTIMNTRKFARRRLTSSTRSHAHRRAKPSTGPRDRGSPLQRLERSTAVGADQISDMAVLADAREKLAGWRLPEWFGYLLLKGSKIDYSGTTIEKLLTVSPTCPLPDMTMLHTSWMKAIISLLISDPEIEIDSWNGLRKWWGNGIFVQGIGLADEHVEQALLPDLRRIMGDGEQPGPVPEKIIQSRRIHNATRRAFVNMSVLIDRETTMFPEVE